MRIAITANTHERTAPLLATACLLLLTGASASKSFNSSSKKKKAGGDRGNLRASSASTVVTAPTSPAEFAYPDVMQHCCRINSGNDHIQLWMEKNADNGYLFLDLASCCVTHFHEDVDSCMDASREIARLGPSRVGEFGSTPDGAMGLRQRRLGKSAKSSLQYYQLPASNYYHSGGGKSGKGSKSVHAEPIHIENPFEKPPQPTPMGYGSPANTADSRRKEFRGCDGRIYGGYELEHPAHGI
jgi:hypothetical protein